jgi:ABC-type branched-subunit amino acid transport system substrate-binding protein
MKMWKLINLVLISALLLTGGLSVASAAPPQQEISYTVKLGDNLWTLAEKYLGGGWIYPAIVAATNQKHAEDPSFAKIKDANLIHPGWKLLIPGPEEAAALLEAYTITLYHMGDITGPYGPITMPLVDGFNDAVAYLNAHGGIRGARVKIGWADTGGKLEESISIYNRFREAKPKPIILFTYSSPENEALRDRYAEDQIPVLTAGLSEPGLYPTGWVFGIVPLYTDQFGFFVDWLVENWDEVKPPKAGDEIKLAFITWDTAYGRGHDTEVTRAYAEEKGVEIVATEYFPIWSAGCDHPTAGRPGGRGQRYLDQHSGSWPGSDP